LRQHAITALSLTDLRGLWEREAPRLREIAFDPTLGRYAVIEQGTGEVAIRASADGRELMRLPNPGLGFFHGVLVFSPDGGHCAVVDRGAPGGNRVHVWNLEHSEKVLDQMARCILVAFHPDGRQFVYCPVGRDAAVWDLVERRELKRFPVGEG